MRAIGVMSFQVNGIPVCRGVVKMFERVITMVWGSPFLLLTCRKPSAPAPPDLLTTMMGRGESLCFSAAPAIRRAIWSAPPPVPAGTTSSMGRVGAHAAPAGDAIAAPSPTSRAISAARLMCDVLLLGLEEDFDRQTNRGQAPFHAWPRRPAKGEAHPPAGPLACYSVLTAARAASRRRKGMTAGISYLSHISSTLPWK